MSHNDQPDVHGLEDVVAAGSNVVSAEGVTSVTTPRLLPRQLSVDVTTQVSVADSRPIVPEPTLRDVEDQIAHIRDLQTRIVPAEEALERLKQVRYWADIQRRRRGFWLRSWLAYLLSFRSERYDESEFVRVTEDTLAEIEATLRIGMANDPWAVIANLRRLGDATDLRVRRLHSTFTALLYSVTTSRELVDDLAQRIGHRELRDEARVHSAVVAQLTRRLETDGATGIAVLSDQFLGTIGIMVELEQRKTAVEELVHKDQDRRRWTVAFVTAYIALILVTAITVGIRWQDKLVVGNAPLSSQRLPLIGIPWPVIVWSLVGSFAAMIYRFNKRPIYDFGDAVKWMLTRPVQGVVLGSAFYLVLVSGLFLMTGPQGGQLNSACTASDIILVLCFLVGFSDRFADAVFNAIVERYSRQQQREEDADQHSHGPDEGPQTDSPNQGNRTIKE